MPSKGLKRCAQKKVQKARANQKAMKLHGVTYEKMLELKKKYRLTPKQYFDMYHNQNGLCLITGLPLDTNFSRGCGMVVDHCKVTGQVRGLLTNVINRGLGLFDHNPEWLRRAADYLERNGAPTNATT
jgi:hypothetical protein